jgi:hypothetical protein
MIRLAVASLIHNNEFFLKEWIEFHVLLGVEKFYLGDHFSQDKSRSILQSYIEKGLVELETVTTPYVNFKHFENNIHCPFYTRIAQKCVGQVKWLACIDSDEFIAPIAPNTIWGCLENSSVYRQHEKELGGIGVNWKVFGTSNTNVAPGKLITETLIHSAPKEINIIKTIIRPERILRFETPHHPIYKPGYHGLMLNGTPANTTFVSNIADCPMNLRHYVNGDLNYFDTHKGKVVARPGWPDFIRLKKRHAANDLREEESRRWFIPELRRRMFGA